MALHVFGDSHSVACFGRISEIDMHWVRAVTMHRIGRDGADFLLEGITILPGDILIFVFGEIDVRAHIGRIADATGRPRRELLEELVDAFLTSISRAAANLGDVRVILTSVVPPSPSHLADTKAFPVWGTLDDRVALTIALNRMLANGARKLGFDFLDFHADYADQAGAMIAGLSDGGVHIAPGYTEPIFHKLQELVGTPLSFLPKDQGATLGLKTRSRLGRALRRIKFAVKPKQEK